MFLDLQLMTTDWDCGALELIATEIKHYRLYYLVNLLFDGLQIYVGKKKKTHET